MLLLRSYMVHLDVSVGRWDLYSAEVRDQLLTLSST